jgi:hypothetical protein
VRARLVFNWSIKVMSDYSYNHIENAYEQNSFYDSLFESHPDIKQRLDPQVIQNWLNGQALHSQSFVPPKRETIAQSK